MKILARNRLKDGTIWFEAYQTDNMVVLHWKKAAKATLSLKGKITAIEKHTAAKKISLRIVQNMIQAYASSLQGKESLHATVIEKNGNAIALCGPSGEGKSTTTAQILFSKKGWRLITDDVAYLEIKNKHVCVQQNPRPVLKLSKKTLHYFERKIILKNKGTFDPHLEKYILAVSYGGNASKKVFPLTGIYILHRRARQKKIKAKKLQGAKAALFLLSNIYNEILRPEDVLTRQFKLCAQWAEGVPVYQLKIPEGMKYLNAISSFFDNHAGRL